jgi:hypothetical protein
MLIFFFSLFHFIFLSLMPFSPLMLSCHAFFAAICHAAMPCYFAMPLCDIFFITPLIFSLSPLR